MGAHTTDTTTFTKLQNPHWLTLARTVWVITVLVFILFYFFSLPNLYASRVDQWRFALPTLDRLGVPLEYLAGMVTAIFLSTGFSAILAALVIFSLRSDNWMVLLMSFALVAIPTTSNVSPPLMQFIATISSIPIAYLFPDGRLAPRWAWIAIAVTIILAGARAMIGAQTTITNPLLLFVLLPMAVAQFQRYRQFYTPIQRQQTKLLVVGVVLLFTSLLLLTVMQFWVYNTYPHPPTPLQIALFLVVAWMTAASAIITYVLTGLSILRRGLYGADVALNRSLVIAGVSLVLFAVFGAGFVIVRALVQILTNTPDPTLPAVIATAAVTLTFNPVRRVVQRFVDQRLFGLRVGLDTLAHRAHEHNTIDTNADTQRIGSLTGTTLGTGSGALRIEGLIGKGGMGEVYRGVQPALNRPVAVKVITERLAQDSESRARFEREAQVVARLRHPNIVAVYDFASINEMAYMVMEYLDGQELDDYLKAQQHLSMDETAVIVRELAGALDYAHAQGVVHRDVKPSNVMLQRVTATGAQFPFKPVLMDFGVVKFGEVDNRLTKTGMIGTLDYVAPEQIMSAKAVDGRADQYSLAVLAFEMLTGQMPFEGSVAQIVFAHLQQPAPDIRDLLTDIPDRVALALMRAMSKQPEDRFATVSEFALAFG